MTRNLKPVTKVSDELKKMLNDAIAIEIAASVQYMWQYVQVIGTKGVAVAGKFKETAMAEMKQAEELAERLWYLNGTPTTQLAPIKVGENLKEFLELDAKMEEEGIRLVNIGTLLYLLFLIFYNILYFLLKLVHFMNCGKYTF